MGWIKKIIVSRFVSSGIRALVLFSQGRVAALKLDGVDPQTSTDFFTSAETILPQLGTALAMLAWSYGEEYFKNRAKK